jgi:hypothetical protein
MTGMVKSSIAFIRTIAPPHAIQRIGACAAPEGRSASSPSSGTSVWLPTKTSGDLRPLSTVSCCPGWWWFAIGNSRPLPFYAEVGPSIVDGYNRHSVQRFTSWQSKEKAPAWGSRGLTDGRRGHGCRGVPSVRIHVDGRLAVGASSFNRQGSPCSFSCAPAWA